MFKFNPLTGKLDLVNKTKIRQLDEDPASPSSEDVWVKATVSGGTGGGKLQAFAGLGFPILSKNTGGTAEYALSYFTKEGTIKRVNLT